jgi:SAM-dependent methyltransferase
MKLLWNPNQNASKSKKYRFFKRFFFFNGYQKFFIDIYTKKPKPLNFLLQIKSDLIENFFLTEVCTRNDSHSFLDIGCNNGFFLYLARYYGLSKVKGIDIDQNLKKIHEEHIYSDIEFKVEDFNYHTSKSDIVMAMSLFHWMLGQALENGDNPKDVLKNIFKKLSLLTNVILIVELVLSDDIKVKKYDHFSFSVNIDDYKKAAMQYFSKLKKIGNSSSTRPVFAMYK